MGLVRLGEGAGVTETTLMEWTNERVGKHQRLKRLEFQTKEFPRNALGKLLKRKLREPYWAEK